ncbi:hypothetical protein B0A54_04909 [Friedmanniomyces endolithicus]|uniref:Heterokaryon incompatibility domain-containing protein n=1 Tax=Friedmanniomyces endolithicus TaxID=329885 RepID=A0A4U0V6G6_9PEZI|nr:hypothetical protein B0A54_04909 [Friedmanniomyces endolithicus]
MTTASHAVSSLAPGLRVMEHLLPPGMPPPFRVPYLSAANDADTPTDEEYQALFSKVILLQAAETPASHTDQYDIWLKHCDGPRLTHLCCALLSQLWFGRLNFLLGVDHETMADDFLGFDEGLPCLTTAVLSEYLVDWSVQIKANFETQNEDERTAFSSEIQLVLEQTALILGHLSLFLDYTYANLVSTTKPEMQREQCGPLYIWVDTLCVPVGPTFQRQRDSQIQKMHGIYQKAYAVIVLDADTLTTEESDPFEMIGMRLYMSAWASRLWTYQEGSLNDRLFVMTKEGYIDLDAHIQAAGARDPLSDDLSHNLVDATLRATIYGLGRSNHDPLLATDDPAEPTEPAADRASQNALQAMKDRSSSRPDSEAFIIGSALGLDIQPILHAAPEDRMPALIKAMAHPPANLMFSIGPRLTHRGFRWAPRSILRSRGGYAANAVEDAVSLDYAQLDADERSPRLMCELHPEGLGLVSFDPGIRLKWVRTRTWPRHPSRGGREQGVLRFEMMGYLYPFRGLDAAFDDQEANLERTEEVADLLREGKDLAILLPVFDPSLRLYMGALVELLGESRALRESASPRQDATRARFVMLVNFGAEVNRLTDGPVEDVEMEREGWTTVKMTGPPTKVLRGDGGKYEGEWMEPRFWLVD